MHCMFDALPADEGMPGWLIPGCDSAPARAVRCTTRDGREAYGRRSPFALHGSRREGAGMLWSGRRSAVHAKRSGAIHPS